MIKQTLTQSEVEWLRCLTINKTLTPVLPEAVRRKFETARLVQTHTGKTMLTESGKALLRQR